MWQQQKLFELLSSSTTARQPPLNCRYFKSVSAPLPLSSSAPCAAAAVDRTLLQPSSPTQASAISWLLLALHLGSEDVFKPES